MISARLLIPALFTTFFTVKGFSQKLPDVQTEPAPIETALKIDGKVSDQEQFKAFNKNTRLFYSVLNDSKSIYFVIKCDDPLIINKIFMGGITLSFNTAGKRKEKDASAVTYPVIVRAARGQGQRNQGGFGQRMGGQAVNGTFNRDSAATERRKQQLAAFREIKVAGFKNITDSLISIYNDYGIKTAANIDTKGSLIFECAVPFDALEINKGKAPEIAYNVRLNGRTFGNGAGGGGGNFGGGNFGGDGGGRGNGGGGQRPGFDLSAFEPTDFWGKYTPVIK